MLNKKLIIESVQAYIGVVDNYGRVKAVFCSRDCTPPEIGKILKNNWSDEIKLAQLLSLGKNGIYILRKNIGVQHNALRYKDVQFADEKGWTSFYERDIGARYKKLKIADSIDEFIYIARKDLVGFLYLYMQKNRTWKCFKIKSDGVVEIKI